VKKRFKLVCDADGLKYPHYFVIEVHGPRKGVNVVLSFEHNDVESAHC
jgi:hypothetical protein